MTTCGGGHLRIEMRALPAGPTVRDNVSNAAFLVGLTLGLAPRMGDWCTRMTFGHARRNFYQAARRGLEAELLWPESTAPSPRPRGRERFSLGAVAGGSCRPGRSGSGGSGSRRAARRHSQSGDDRANRSGVAAALS